MPRWEEDSLSEPQRRWFATVRTNLETETGRTLQAWAELARACPEMRHRARLAWMKANYGLGQNRASLILAEAFPSEASGGADGADPLWKDAHAGTIFGAIRTAATGLDGVVVGVRKGYTAFSRRWQFAAARPAGTGVRLGLAVPQSTDARLQPRGRESWSERLTATLELAAASDLDCRVVQLLHQAAEGA
jgi:hypothetical protein